MAPLKTPPCSQEAILQLERAEAHWARVDELLRRLATRLTYAAEGRTTALDTSLHDIRRQVREPVTEEAYESLIAALTAAVKSLDESPLSASHDTTPTTDSSESEILLELIDHLRLGDTTARQLNTLREAIATTTDISTLVRHIEALAGLVNRRVRQIGEQRDAAERLLTQVTTQLDEWVKYLNDEHVDQRQGNGERQEFDRRLSGEIDVLGTHVQQARDIDSLQEEVQSRLVTISYHLKTFREREDARDRDWQRRAEKMNYRIRELERSAQIMEATLRQEQQLAATDPLTGIANRMVFEQHMTRACIQVTQRDCAICLLVLDIDHFKHINDSFGHSAGDRALRIVAEQLKAGLSADALLARYGGEEFAVILTATHAEAGLRIAETLRVCIENTGFCVQQQPVRITLSCGLTMLQARDMPESAFERADRALYRAKHGGRNRCEML